MFVPEQEQKKSEKEMKKMLEHKLDGKFKMQAKTAEGKIQEVEWSAHILLNNQKMPVGMILITKK